MLRQVLSGMSFPEQFHPLSANECQYVLCDSAIWSKMVVPKGKLTMSNNVQLDLLPDTAAPYWNRAEFWLLQGSSLRI